MSSVEMMYQFYPSYFSHKSTTNDYSKFSAASLSDNASSGHYIHSHSLSALSSCAGNDNRADDIGNDVDSDIQPKVSQYINPNCVLLSYFTGDTSTVVDEHFSRALSQPSSFNLDKSTGMSFSKMKSEKPLMCHRKLPASFWNSSWKPPPTQFASTGNFDYSRDPYFTSSWYSLQNNWPYRLPSHGHSDLGSTLSYPSFDTASKLAAPYQSLVFPGSYDSRQSKYDFAKNMESLAGSSGYYGLSRLGMDFTSKGNMDPSVTGLEYQLQSARRELCW